MPLHFDDLDPQTQDRIRASNPETFAAVPPAGTTQPMARPARIKPWVGAPLPADDRFRPRNVIRAQGPAGTPLAGAGAPPVSPRPPGARAAAGASPEQPSPPDDGRYNGRPTLSEHQFGPVTGPDTASATPTPGGEQLPDMPHWQEAAPHIMDVARRRGAAMQRLAAPGGWRHIASYAAGEHLFGSAADPRPGMGAPWWPNP